MFRFWSNDSRGSGQTIVEAHQPMQLDTTIRPEQSIPPIHATIAESNSAGPARPPTTKRTRDEDESHDVPQPKRPRQAATDPIINVPSSDDISFTSHLSDRQDRARDAIQFHFGLEILYKHDELRLIDQELAKCQIALEQLRRCHLIPYPVNSPTPDQMVDICNGKGPALKQQGKEVPRWAAPFGVVDGPYARHYAKWLIPDPMFDGMLPEWHPPYQTSRARVTPEGRTTRNSIGDIPSKGRPVRGNAGQKLQALTTGAQPPREKGACILERKKDGLMVKLVCIDCHRGDFLSIQGFINHCRIAHRRDFKSHEEAAIYCGHPIDVNDAAASPQQAGNDEKQAAATPTTTATPASASASAYSPSSIPPAQPSGLVHPLARADMTKQDAYLALQSRIKQSLKLYHQGKLPGVTYIPGQDAKKEASSFVASAETPYLSAFMRSKKFSGDLQQLISDATTPLDMDYISSPGEEADEMTDSFDSQTPMSQAPIMRMPARTAMAPPAHAASTRPTSSKGPSPVLAYSQPVLKQDRRDMILPEEDVDMESPNTVTSNVAPSLVSDDGEYDESDDGSSESDAASDSLEAESISDVTEINMEDDGETPPLRHQGCGAPNTTVRLRKEVSKTVTLVSPVKNTTKERRHRSIEKL